MNIELYEGQVATVYITLEGEADVYKVYGGTSKGQFHTEVGDDDMHWEIYVPAESTAGCSVPRYDIFAKRVSTGQEWRILSGKIATKKRQSQVEGECVSPVEYHVTLPLVEDMVIVDGGQVLIGIKGDKGERGISAYDVAVQNGFEGDEREFTNMMVCVQTYAEQAQKSSTDAYDAQILSEVAAINALQSAQDAKDAAENVECDGGMTAEERATLNGAAQREGDNTFTAANTFTGSVDMSTAQVTPPEGWNVEVVTAEQVKAVVPVSFGTWSNKAWAGRESSISIGDGAGSDAKGISIGAGASGYQWSIVIGYGAKSNNNQGIVIGEAATSGGINAIAIGKKAANDGTNGIAMGDTAKVKKPTAITIGSQFTETTSDGNVTHTCTTEGTGSITIGAGANTLNTTTADGSVTESSNSVTIGCKAENKGADSVVIGAQAKGGGAMSTIIGCGASEVESCTLVGYKVKGGRNGAALGRNAEATWNSLAAGNGAKATGKGSTVIGMDANGSSENAISIGAGAKVSAKNATAVGVNSRSNDIGATVIRSTAEDGTYTQLYFSGANTPLANTYENGEAMMGYVVRDSAGNVMTDAEGNAMVGTQKLSVLFPNNRGENAFTPAMLSMDEDWTPKPMFRPSDLDLPTEEPSEPEEYKPLPVYPIVEPEIEEEIE